MGIKSRQFTELKEAAVAKEHRLDNHVPSKVPGVIDTDLGEETVLFHPIEMNYYGLNESATLIWQRIDGKSSVADITDALVQHAPDQAAQVREEVPTLVTELHRLGFIETAQTL